MTHLHSIIKNALLPVCLETTAKARQEEEKSVEIDAKIDPVMTELRALMRGKSMLGNVNIDYIKGLCAALAIVTRKPYLANAWKEDEKQKQIFAPLTIVMPVEDSNWGNVSVESIIVVHGGNLHGISQRGEVVSFNKLPEYQVRIATDEEVEHFLDSLTGTAIRQILKNDLFAPMIEAMTQETELVVEKEQNEGVDKQSDGGEVPF